MQSRRVRVILATSHPLAAYGGVRFPEDAIEGIAEAFASGSVPMRLNHDMTRPVRPENVRSGTERLADGYLAAWGEFEVSAEVWDAYQREIAQAGAPGGMSISVTTPLSGEATLSESPVLIAADAHHFTDAEIRGAVETLSRIDPSAHGRRLLQFAIDPTALIVIQVAASAVASAGIGVTSNAIYDALKAFFSKRRRGKGFTVIDLEFKAQAEGARSLSLRIEAENLDQVGHALEGLEPLLKSAGTAIYLSSGGQPFAAVDVPEEVLPGPSSERDGESPDGEDSGR